MKKALSVLLVAAALFGFYGSAVTVNDLLACKDYWEEAGEKSTADMNKLEDGLNQLLENEEAYLDGIDQVAEGEKTLAQGEADYADGQETLAKGEADYAAAPAKLRDAERKLAAAKEAISEGESQLNALNDLISGIEQLIAGFTQAQAPSPKSLKDGYQELKDGRDMILKGYKGAEGYPDVKTSLMEAAGLLQQAEMADMAGKIQSAMGVFAEQSESISYKDADYSDFVDALKDLKPGLEAAGQVIDSKLNSIEGFLGAIDDLENAETKTDAITALTKIKNYATGFGITDLADGAGSYIEALSSLDEETDATAIAATIATAQETVAGVKIPVGEGEEAVQVPLKTYLSSNKSTLEEKKATLTGYISKAGDAINGYPLLSGATAKAGRKQLAEGVETLINEVYKSGNKEIIGGLEKAFNGGEKQVKGFAQLMLAQLNGASSMDDFHNNMSMVVEKLNNVLPSLKAKSKEGQKTLNDGKKQYKDGLAQYKQGLADYKAAPAKLAAGRQALAEGLEQLMDGRKQLEDGKAQLAQYEDGEQQIRDGLATLFNTEADLELESIANRLNGDGDFDNGDNHLEIEEGLNAVEVGRGYQAEDGVLITNEIMGRAVATGGLLAAAVLAVLAAILSFLNKNKGAGVFAILAAVAGAFGAFYGPAQGTYFSEIAGSTIGATTWVAAGVLGAVALVHAIAHFAAKKAA